MYILKKVNIKINHNVFIVYEWKFSRILCNYHDFLVILVVDDSRYKRNIF